LPAAAVSDVAVDFAVELVIGKVVEQRITFV